MANLWEIKIYYNILQYTGTTCTILETNLLFRNKGEKYRDEPSISCKLFITKISPKL
jgi:hypothetical protein